MGIKDRQSQRIGLLFLVGTSRSWGLDWPAMKVLHEQLPPLFARGSAAMGARELGALALILPGVALVLRRAGIAV